jgi:hypothetical protein
MKRILSYSLLLSLLLLLTCRAFSINTIENEVNYVDMKKDKIASIHNTVTNVDLTETNFIVSNDNDENENCNNSFPRKTTTFSYVFLQHCPVSHNYICVTSIFKSYFSTNFSKLPRFNFIALRVLRL